MDTSKAKEKILQRIRQGISSAQFKQIEEPVLTNKEIFVTPNQPLIDIFKEELTKIKGEFFYCQNHDEVVEKLKLLHNKTSFELCYSPDAQFNTITKKSGIPFTEKFEQADDIMSGISSCEYLVARYGSVMVSSALAGARRIFSFPEIHIVIAYKDQLVLEIEEGITGIQNKYGENMPSQITNITGPSRTADIEKTLILGAHGPKRLVVFVVENRAE